MSLAGHCGKAKSSMASSLRDPSDPQEWLRRARSNLARAQADFGLPDVLLEDLCFDASQAAEKAIKAILVNRSTPVPKTHSIAELLRLAASAGIPIPDDLIEASRLTYYAVTTRYPGITEEVTKEEYLTAVRLAVAVVQWAELQIDESREENKTG